MNPKISIIMGTYNEEPNQIKKAIKSILNQTFKDFEFIIIIDNPKNIKVKKAISQIKDKRIQIIENKENLGLAKTLNIGITKAKGKYIARMDADDFSNKNRLKVQYEFMEKNKKTDLCFTWAKYIDEKGRINKKINPKNIFTKNLKKTFFKKHIFTHPTLLCKKEVLFENKYNEDFKKAQDYELWIRLIYKNYNFKIIEKYLFERAVYSDENYDDRIRKVRNTNKYKLKALSINFKIFNIYFLKEYIKTLIFSIILILPKPVLKLAIKLKGN